jgi:hypothetical protein
VQPLLTARRLGAQGRCSWWQVTRKHLITRANRVGSVAIES